MMVTVMDQTEDTIMTLATTVLMMMVIGIEEVVTIAVVLIGIKTMDSKVVAKVVVVLVVELVVVVAVAIQDIQKMAD